MLMDQETKRLMKLKEPSNGAASSAPKGCRAAKKAENTVQSIPSEPPVGRQYSSGLWRDKSGQQISYHTPGTCAGCFGERDEEAKRNAEPTLLCDGSFCGREYHLKCAGLSEIPETDFFCLSCCPLGTSKDLNEYFERCESDKSVCGTSEKFAVGNIRQIMVVSIGIVIL